MFAFTGCPAISRSSGRGRTVQTVKTRLRGTTIFPLSPIWCSADAAGTAGSPFRFDIRSLNSSPASAFFFGFYTLGVTGAALKFSLFVAMHIAMFFTDLEERILPDEFTIGGAVVGVIFAAFVPIPGAFFELLLPDDWDRRMVGMIESALGALFLSGVLWAIAELYFRVRKREGLGLGDVKMVGMIAAFLGISGALFTVIVGSVLGSVVGLAYIWLAKKEAATYELPFGTFLAVAAILVAIQTGPLQHLFQ